MGPQADSIKARLRGAVRVNACGQRDHRGRVYVDLFRAYNMEVTLAAGTVFGPDPRIVLDPRYEFWLRAWSLFVYDGGTAAGLGWRYGSEGSWMANAMLDAFTTLGTCHYRKGLEVQKYFKPGSKISVEVMHPAATGIHALFTAEGVERVYV